MSFPAPPTGLCERWNAVRARLERAAVRAGRPTPRLIAVTKSVSPELALDLAQLGQLDLAENRVQELELKVAHLNRCGVSPRWHLVGHLQRNKARRAVSMCHSIHSVDSTQLLEALNRHGAEQASTPELYLEVDYVGDGVRSGLSEDEVPQAVEAIGRLSQLRLVGLMTIAPLPEFAGDTRRARAVFAQLRRLAEKLPPEPFQRARPLLSMGMSSDFEIATEEGSDCVRIGSAIFEAEEERA